MHARQFHLNTLKEAPADTEVISHQLMTRAGMIRRVAGGIYTYMPLGLRVLRKIEAIVREEMNRAGAIELLMPVVQPAELWQESGRWDEYGSELLRIKDRHQRDFVLQPTSEEVITDIARNEIHSWRQLPVNFYHIQTKFRDERRPRFGLMRSREFLMKDAYSFDRNHEDAVASYENMYQTYHRIFTRLGLNFRTVAADTGAIGGSRSHEFQVIADTGEDRIVHDPDTSYAANIELAEAPCLLPERGPAQEPLTMRATPEAPKCELVAAQLNIPLEQTVRSVVLASDDPDAGTRLFLLLIRGDHESNEIKIGKLPALKDGYRLATEAEILSVFGCEPGYLGPVGLPEEAITIIADRTVAHMHDFVCGANVAGHHYTGVNWGRDVPEPDLIADIRNVAAGDPSPEGGTLAIQRGIEVGHVFLLGDRYSKAMQASFLDDNGQPGILQMGCYGIGIGRIAAAAIEQNHDDQGMIWPRAMAPFEIVLCPVAFHKSEAVRSAALQLYNELKALQLDVILDDRDIRPGVMFADWELIGVPLRVTIGERSLQRHQIEIQARRAPSATHVPVDKAADAILQALKEL